MERLTHFKTIGSSQLQRLVEHVNAGVVIHAHDSTILLANQEASRILGLSVSQMQGKSAIELAWQFVRMDGTTLPVKEYPVEKVISTLQPFDNYVIGINKPNTNDRVWVEVSAYPEFDKDLMLSMVVITFIDISEKKESENQINVLYEIVHGVLSTSGLPELLALIHSSLKKVMYAENCFFALYDEHTKLFNFPYYSDQYDDGFHPQEMLKSCTYYVYKTGNTLLITPEIFQKLKDDNEIELIGPASPSWIGIPLKTSSRIIGVMVLQHYSKAEIFNDRHVKFLDSIGNHVANVIERKRTENELERSHSLIEATLESTADGILVVNKKGEITNYNRKFLDLWKIPDSIIALKSDERLLNFVLEQLTDPKSFIAKVEELYHHDEECSTDYLEFKDGRIFKRYSQAQVLNEEYIGRVWSFLDITSQVETLKALHQSESQLRELNATKDKFFSIIAHDLKSPFSGILGFSNILTEQIRQKDFENIEEYAEIIQYSAQRAFDLLTNLMEWSTSQSGRLDFDPQLIDISTIIQEVIDLVKISALQKSILLTKKIEHPIAAVIDKKMISSVVRNLITNAIKFTHPGGAIEICLNGSETDMKITVKDNGVGIEPGELIRLFKIDQSFSVPGTQNEKGTGLGLILCKEFIHKHGGTIWAESEPGKGSLFCFTIPTGT